MTAFFPFWFCFSLSLRRVPPLHKPHLQLRTSPQKCLLLSVFFLSFSLLPPLLLAFRRCFLFCSRLLPCSRRRRVRLCLSASLSDVRELREFDVTQLRFFVVVVLVSFCLGFFFSTPPAQFSCVLPSRTVPTVAHLSFGAHTHTCSRATHARRAHPCCKTARRHVSRPRLRGSMRGEEQ